MIKYNVFDCMYDLNGFIKDNGIKKEDVLGLDGVDVKFGFYYWVNNVNC